MPFGRASTCWWRHRDGCSITRRAAYAKLNGLEYLVLDEADRMLDMGFLPDIKRMLRHIPARSGRRSSSAPRCPHRLRRWPSEMLKQPDHDQPAATIGAGGRHHAGGVSGAPAPQGHAARRAAAPRHPAARRWSSRAPSTARIAWPNSSCGIASTPSAFTETDRRVSGRRRWPDSRAAAIPVLVATDIAARGIDVEALSHVVNFDVPPDAGRVHPSRRPHRTRRSHRRRLHVRGAGRRAGPPRHRTRDRSCAAARDAS